MARDRERPHYEVEDYGGRLAKHVQGARAWIKMPEGLQMFRPKKTGKPCPICDVRSPYLRSPKKEDKDKARALKPKERQLFLVLDNDNPDLGIQLWEEAFWNFGRNLDSYIKGADKEDIPAYRRYFHPVEGFTLKVTCTEETSGEGGQKYTDFTIHQFKARKEDLPDKLFKHGFDLDGMVDLLSYARLKSLFEGTAEDDETDQDRGSRSTAVARNDDRPKRRDDSEDRQESKRRDEEPPARKRDEDDDRPARSKRDEDDRPPAKKEESSKRRDDDEDRPPARKRDDDDDRPARGKRDEEPPKRKEPEPEPAKSKKYVPAKGDAVEFVYKEKTYTGVIDSLDDNKEMASIEVEGRDRPMNVDYDDLVPLTSKAKKKAEDDEPPKRKRDEDDDRPARSKRDEDEPAAKKKGSWDDDDDDRAFKKK
jgi:hypothetical protein